MNLSTFFAGQKNRFKIVLVYPFLSFLFQVDKEGYLKRKYGATHGRVRPDKYREPLTLCCSHSVCGHVYGDFYTDGTFTTDYEVFMPVIRKTKSCFYAVKIPFIKLFW